MMPPTDCASGQLPVLIIGAGISGLLLAQQLKESGISFMIFERDETFHARGAGWGLTLHWSLPALRQLIPGDLLAKLPDTYVDRAAVERGECSAFPFFDLSTGQLQGSSPRAPEHERIRVTRKRLCELLSDQVDVQWGKEFNGFREDENGVDVFFKDGTEYRGRLVIGCDGSHSKVRLALLRENSISRPIPVRMFGFTMTMTADQAKPIRELDPFFLQGTSSASNIFMYISLLEAPQGPHNHPGKFVYQICISQYVSREPSETPTNKERLDLIRQWSQQWAEPFRSFISLVTDSTKVVQLKLDDFAPWAGIHPLSKVILIGDALHAMSMYRGEGANHVIVDVLDFKNILLPQLRFETRGDSREHCARLVGTIIERVRPAVLASRQACLDAHNWSALSPTSLLLTKRQMFLDFDG